MDRLGPGLGLSGCVTLDLPSIAHVHVGHAVTAWTDTPGNRALFDVAQAEAAVAAEYAGYAVEGARDPAAVRLHLGHVLHAADPTREPTGPGSGYGLVRAVDGCVDHLGYAAEVRDASGNLRAGLPKVLAVLQPLRREARAVATLAAEGRRGADAGQAVARVAHRASSLDWLRIYTNKYNAAEFVALLGFADEKAFEAAREVGELLLEEVLFTGLRKPLGMSYLAGYNQFVCTPLSWARPG